MEEKITDLVETEAVENLTNLVDEATEVSHSGNNGLKTVAKTGAAMVLGAVLWERVAKPIGRKAKSAIKKAKAKKAAKRADQKTDDDIDVDKIVDEVVNDDFE